MSLQPDYTYCQLCDMHFSCKYKRELHHRKLHTGLEMEGIPGEEFRSRFLHHAAVQARVCQEHGQLFKSVAERNEHMKRVKHTTPQPSRRTRRHCVKKIQVSTQATRKNEKKTQISTQAAKKNEQCIAFRVLVYTDNNVSIPFSV